jgi:hypothetical protein
MKASGALDFDAKTRKAITLNGSSYVSGLACTSRDLGVLLWTVKTRLRFLRLCGGLVAMRERGASRVIHRCCDPPML